MVLNVNMTTGQAIEALANGDSMARQILLTVCHLPRGRIALLDIDDMNMRGPQIVVAYRFIRAQNLTDGGGTLAFITACSDRNADMIAAVNSPVNRYPPGTTPARTSMAHKPMSAARVPSSVERVGFSRGARVRR